MALTLDQLKLAVGVHPTNAELDDLIGRYQRAGAALAAKQLDGATAPDDIVDEAVIRFAGFLFGGGGGRQPMSRAVAWRHSGAESLLAPWVVRRGVIAGATA